MTAYRPLTTLATRLVRFLGDRIAARSPGRGRLCVLNYHRILEKPDPLLATEPDVATFRWQMQVLADGFNVLSIDQAMAALDTGTLPPRAVCITFDDGYRSTHDLALPVLREFGFPAMVFVTSGFVDNGSMWNDHILEALRTMSVNHLDLEDAGLGSYPLGTLEERRQAVALLTEKAKYLAPPLRQALVDRLDTVAGRPLREPMLTRQMIHTLVNNGVDIGAHTVSHPILTSLDDDSARAEIVGAKLELEAISGRPVRYFAYPNGKAGKDFDQRHATMAREAGFAAAFTTAIGAVSAKQDRYRLPRSRPWDTHPTMFAARLLHWIHGGNRAGE